MSTIVLETPETISKCGYGSTINSKITFDDWKASIIDKQFPETELLTSFDKQLDEIEKTIGLKPYSDILVKDKKDLQDKVTLWKMTVMPYGILEEKWNSSIKGKFAKTLFKPEIESYPDKVRDTKSPSGFKTVTKVRLINNLTNANENSLYEIVSFILENIKLEDTVKADFETVIEKINSVKKESVDIKRDTDNKLINSSVVKANSDLFNIAGDFVKNRLDTKLKELKIIIKKHEMSIAFLTWKIKAISIRMDQNDIKESNLKAVDMSEKLMSKCKTDKKFVNLMNIANKWNL
jgi:hypothetical protein